ncbi:MAG: hypothetical protein AB7V62_03415 [Thermoleophilia bacterium]
MILALAALLPSATLLVACGGGSDPPAAAEPTGELQEIEAARCRLLRGEIVLWTAEGERTFTVRDEERAAVDPDHFASLADVPTLGFRVFYTTDAGSDYAVSVEEIAAHARLRLT